MATKTTIQNLINVNLADGSEIIAEEHREVEDALLVNSYGTPIEELNAVATQYFTNTTRDSSTKLYRILYTKQGRIVSFSGNLTNKTGAILSNSVWFTFDASEYYPSSDILEFSCLTSSGTTVNCRIQSGNFTVLDAIGNNQTIYFNINYFTQD